VIAFNCEGLDEIATKTYKRTLASSPMLSYVD